MNYKCHIAVSLRAIIALLLLGRITCTIATAQEFWYPTLRSEFKSGSNSISRLDFTLPLRQTESSMMFLDFRGAIDDSDNDEVSIGIANRTLLASDWIFGAYAFFDRKNTNYNNQFYQGTFGFEFLHDLWDVRTNVYLPSPGGKDAGTLPGFGSVRIGGNRFFMNTQRREESAYYGADYEMGRLVTRFGANQNEVRVYGGAYFYDNSENNYPYIAGPRVRMETRLFDVPFLGTGSRVTLLGEFQWDSVRGAEAYAGIGVQIPLGRSVESGSRGRSLTRLERRMYNPIRRSEIVTGTRVTGKASELLNDAEGDPLRLADANNSLTTAVTEAGAAGTIVVSGPVNTPGVELQDGQRLTSITKLNVATQSSNGASVSVRFPGTRGTINGVNPANAVITLADNVIVDSVNITGGDDGILGAASVVGATISNNNIMNTGGDGIQLSSANANQIVNNTISFTGGEGILARFNGGIISNNTISDTTGSGIRSDDNVGTILNNTIARAGENGIRSNNNAGTITNNQISDSTLNGILAGFNTSTISNNMIDGGTTGITAATNAGTISSNTITNSTANGMVAANNAGTISGNTVSDAGGRGIRAADNTGSISSNTVLRSNGNGIEALDNAGSLSSNTITSAGGQGILATGNTAGGTVSSNTITQSGGNGIGVDNNVGTVSSNMITSAGGNGIGSTSNAGTISLNTIITPNSSGILAGSNSGTISSNTITSPGSRGILAENNSATGMISSNIITQSSHNGLEAVNNAGSISGNEVSNSGRGLTANRSGFVITGNTGRVEGNTSNNNDVHGFNAGTDNSGVISMNNASGNGVHGFLATGNTGTISGNTAVANTSNGLFLRFNGIGGTISGNTATNNTVDGINVRNNAGTVDNNTANNNTGNGFDLRNRAGGTFSNNTANTNNGLGYRFSGTGDPNANNNSAAGNANDNLPEDP